MFYNHYIDGQSVVISDCKERSDLRDRWHYQDFALTNNLRLSHNGQPDPAKVKAAETR